MKIIHKFSALLVFGLLAFSSSAHAQFEQQQQESTFHVTPSNTGSSTPINLNQILSGKSAGGSVSGQTRVQPYTPSGGAAYTMSMTPSQVMKSRARRDAYAQAQERVTTDYMNQSYLDQEYQQAFQKYQQQFRTGGQSSGSAAGKSAVPTNVKVKYQKKKKQNFVTPQRVFRSY